MNRYVVCVAALAIAATIVAAQTPATPAQTQEANVQAYINLLRQDLNKGKVQILTDLMVLSPDQAAKFWPVYNEYSIALTKLGDERIVFIRLYAESYPNTSDEIATKISMGLLDVETKRVELRKDYFQRMSRALTPKDAAKWLQIEAQIEKLVDLQMLASLPIVE